MYEEKPKKSLSLKNLNVNWKSLLIKLGILLVAVFIILWLVSLVNKDKKHVESNLATNLQSMKTAAKEYFTGSRLPSNVNGRKKITLNEMFESKLLVEFKDQNNKACDGIGSFAEATKVNNTDYTIKVKLVCGEESDYVIDTISFEENNVDIPVIDNNDNNVNNNQTDTTTNTTTNNKNNQGNKTTNNNSAKKPSNSNSSTNNKPITNVTTPNVNNNTNTCSITENRVNSIIAAEYSRLNNEMVSLKNKTNATLYLEAVNNINSNRIQLTKSGNCITSYKILFTMKQKVNYAGMTIYEYYLNSDGSRTILTDRRSLIGTSNGINNNNSNSSNISSSTRVTSISLNRTSLDLYVDDTYNLVATINPNNATNKTITWKSSNTSVAKVSSAGKVTALREGSAVITATVDGKSATTRVYVTKEATTRYCKTNTERVYSTSYVSASGIKSEKYMYTIALNTKNTNFYDIQYGNLTTGNEYVNAYNYWKNKNKPLSLINGNNGGIDAGSYSNLINHSLKSYNFTPTVNYAGRNSSTLYFDVNVRIKNVNYIQSATPYYTSSNNGVYFLPLYFDVTTIDYNDCRNITSSQVKTYVNKGYVRAN